MGRYWQAQLRARDERTLTDGGPGRPPDPRDHAPRLAHTGAAICPRCPRSPAACSWRRRHARGDGAASPGGAGLGPLASTDPTGPGGMGAPPPARRRQAGGGRQKRRAPAPRGGGTWTRGSRPPPGASRGRRGAGRATARVTSPRSGLRTDTRSARAWGAPGGTRPGRACRHPPRRWQAAPSRPALPHGRRATPDPHLPGAGAARRVGGRPPAGTGRGGQPRGAGTGHACPDPPRGHALPAGVEDGGGHAGGVPGGPDPDPARVALASVAHGWQAGGRRADPPAARLRLGADRGGRHGDRTRLGPVERPHVADTPGRPGTVGQLPPGPSPWPTMAPRLWSPIRLTWRGRPLVRPEGLVARVGATPTRTGLPGAGGVSSRHLSPHEHGGRPGEGGPADHLTRRSWCVARHGCAALTSG